MKVCLECLSKFENQNWVCPSCGFQTSKLNGFYIHTPEYAEDGDGGFKKDAFSHLYDLEKENFWFRSRNKLICWALKKYKKNLDNFLEIGCGTGFVLNGILKTFPQISLLGSEIFLHGLSFAKSRIPGGNFMQMDARKVPFIDEFDAIGAFDVLEHIEEDDVVLFELNKALRRKGLLLITVPQHPRLWSPVDDYSCHVRRYKIGELEEKVGKAGFSVTRSSSFVTFLLPAMVLSRFRQKSGENLDPRKEFKISPILNFIFFAILFIEFTLIKMGCNFPVGGSRLLVATKD